MCAYTPCTGLHRLHGALGAHRDPSPGYTSWSEGTVLDVLDHRFLFGPLPLGGRGACCCISIFNSSGSTDAHRFGWGAVATVGPVFGRISGWYGITAHQCGESTRFVRNDYPSVLTYLSEAQVIANSDAPARAASENAFQRARSCAQLKPAILADACADWDAHWQLQSGC
ncbi:hypothetical protein T492DRAFT_477599 [Pavlovales sp. CCMP2436]|nr:hypothetical protein T492DRAFT_477599 [Pavlovales sp. CCMP2436]